MNVLYMKPKSLKTLESIKVLHLEILVIKQPECLSQFDEGWGEREAGGILDQLLHYSHIPGREEQLW